MTHRSPPPAAAAKAGADTLTVLYDGACPLCQREMAHYRALATPAGPAAPHTGRMEPPGLVFTDISAPDAPLPAGQTQAQLLRRFHVQQADGQLLSGAEAFVALWARLPGWRWLAAVALWPGVTPMLEVAYRAFLPLRPTLQRWARRSAHTPTSGD